MNKSYKLTGMLPIFLLAIILVSVIPSVSSGSEVINTFLTYEDASATSKTVTQGDYVNLYLVAYGHGESLEYEKLELVSATLIFKEYVAGNQILDYTWLYTKSPYVLNTGILTPGAYTLRFTASTKITHSAEYSDLHLIILPKVIPPVCGNNLLESGEQCDKGSLNGNVCSPLYGSSCTYCSSSCKSITLAGPYCGDTTCNGAETCSTCSNDCGACPPVCDLTNAHWSLSNVPTGTVVSLIVQGSNCAGKTIYFKVWNDKSGLSDLYVTDTATAVMSSSGSASSAWVAIAPYDGDSTPEYYFVAKVADSSESIKSGNLLVTIPPRCGDGQCNGVETCSTCSTDCGTCPIVCGDGKVEGSETCDRGTSNGQTCSPSYGSSCTYCSSSCKLITLNGPRCGDGTCSNGETCSTCSTDCGTCAPVCGNGKIEGTEQCDREIFNGQACTPSYGTGCTYCSSLCKLTTVIGPYCGDNTCNGPETCSTCSQDCGTCAPLCGNGKIEGTEQCDDGNKVNGDGCSSTCQTETPKECILQLTKSVNDTNVQPGEMVTFTLKYRNIGDGTCTGGGVKIQDVLNSNLHVIAYSANVVAGDNDGQGISFGYYEIPAFNEATNTLTFNAHTVSSGEEGKIMISAKVLDPSQCGDFQISNYFKVWSNEKGWQNSNTINLLVDNDCYQSSCGNHILDSGEQCDDGNKLNNDGCSSTCKLEVCGDNICNHGETCSTCSHDCGICPPSCGNGLKEGTEQCDRGILNGQVCSPLYGSSCNYCSSSCKLITINGPFCGDDTCNGSETCSTCSCDCGACQPVCGNGIKEGTEQCDDHNNVNNDGCSSTCKIEVCGDNICNHDETCSTCSQDCGICPPSCGNGIKEGLEQCDDHNLLNNDGCSSTCKIEKCGDGIKQTNEQCDDHNLLNNDGCSSICKNEVCGDHICNHGETCSTCSQDCGICSPSCGNGIKEGLEQCDDGNTLSGDGCSSNCKIEFCGDNTCNDNETCSTCPCDCGACAPTCGDGQCNGAETCSTCSQDCGTCPEPKNCTVCKDSKPLDDSNYDYYYLEYLNRKPTVILDETTTTDVPLDLDKAEKSVLGNKFPFIALILIIGVLILLIFIVIIKLVKR
ncbi:MAG: DUF4215 domain-containing protein [Candidatus Pacearchaeota archaeon]|nr:DUF4215 domain-containing protein [Candidatus Pacearchaeota archaeon]